MTSNIYLDTFEKNVKMALFEYLHQHQRIDERMPDAPDIEMQWHDIAEAYMPDGVREFQGYPLVSPALLLIVRRSVALLQSLLRLHCSSRLKITPDLRSSLLPFGRVNNFSLLSLKRGLPGASAPFDLFDSVKCVILYFSS